MEVPARGGQGRGGAIGEQIYRRASQRLSACRAQRAPATPARTRHRSHTRQPQRATLPRPPGPLSPPRPAPPPLPPPRTRPRQELEQVAHVRVAVRLAARRDLVAREAPVEVVVEAARNAGELLRGEGGAEGRVGEREVGERTCTLPPPSIRAPPTPPPAPQHTRRSAALTTTSSSGLSYAATQMELERRADAPTARDAQTTARRRAARAIARCVVGSRRASPSIIF